MEEQDLRGLSVLGKKGIDTKTHGLKLQTKWGGGVVAVWTEDSNPQPLPYQFSI